jgi:FkbM family methyltransferase
VSHLRAFLNYLNLHFPECELRVLDVGARLGLVDQGYTELPALLNLHLEGIEPDREEAERLVADRSLGGYAAVHPVAVSDTIGTRTLHLTALKGCTSLYPPNMETLAGHTASSWFEPVGQVEVETTTLDALYADAPGFHVIKVDVQGAELDVLRAAEATVAETVGISLEVQFHELYHGQGLFPDVHTWMLEHDFRLIQLHSEGHFYNGQVLEANCLYLRNPALIATAEDLLRRVAVALLVGNVQYVELLLREHGDVLDDRLLKQLLVDLGLQLDGRKLGMLGPHN